MEEHELQRIVKRLRIAGTDDQRFEVKSCAGGLPHDIGRTISAFSNASGGTIICGLDERSGFAPALRFDAAKIQDALANYCTQRMTPAVHPSIELVPFEDSIVLVAEIPELRPKEKPCYLTASGCYSGSYVRIGDGDRRLSHYEVSRLLAEHEQPRFDDEIVAEASLSDLDSRLVAGLLARERHLHPQRFKELDDETALCKLHAIKHDENGEAHPTLAGLLALGSYPQEFFPRLVVSFTRYAGTEKASDAGDGRRFIDSFTCVGPIPDMVEDAVSAVLQNMRVGSRIEGAYRYDVPDYPEAAVREAIANALMHRDYSPDARGSAVAVDMYADRLEITNVGGLYGTATVESLASDFAPGMCRNQRLAALLENTPSSASSAGGAGRFVVENRGTGFLVMRKELAKYGKPEPEVNDSLSYFRIVFRNAPATPEEDEDSALGYTARAGSSSNSEGIPFVFEESPAREPGKSRTSRIEYAIVEIAAAQESVSIRELMDQLKRSRPTVHKRVADLVKKGVLVPTAARNSPQQRYRLAEPVPKLG